MIAVHLAAPFSRAEELRRYAAELRAAGVTITSRWHDGTHDMAPADDATRARYAQEDIDDLERADAIVVWTSHAVRGRGGYHVEFGYTLNSYRRILLVGDRLNVFHWLPRVEHHDTWPSARAALLSDPATCTKCTGKSVKDMIKEMLERGGWDGLVCPDGKGAGCSLGGCLECQSLSWDCCGGYYCERKANEDGVQVGGFCRENRATCTGCKKEADTQ